MRTRTEQTYKERVLRTLVYIQNHLDEAISLADLARRACFSPYHFHRVFRGTVGESIHEHIRRLRLERVAHLLKTSRLPVTRIAFEAGFETHEAFTRAFRAMFDESPLRFRQAQRVPEFRSVPSGVHYVVSGGLDDFRSPPIGDPPMNVRIEQLDPMRLAFMRHVGPYREVGQTWAKLAAWAGSKGLLGPGATLVGIPLDDPDITPPERVRYDVGLVVDDSVTPEGDVGVQETSGGECAVVIHHGPPERIGETFERLYGEWLPASGRELRPAPNLIIVRNWLPSMTPETMSPEIFLPLKGS
jgi:AraC family transcriptional regulator